MGAPHKRQLGPMDAVFKALGNATRRRMVEVIRAAPGSSVSEVCHHFEMSRVAVMKHLRLLEKAGLIASEKVGRKRKLYHDAVPIQMIYDRWTKEYSASWARRHNETT